jgi:two-component system, sensor histidine kinase and response regulator
MIENKEFNNAKDILFNDLRFLIVDDHPINCEMLKYYIESVGGNTSSAMNGLEALKMCKHNYYNVIIMDIQMPEMNGFEATAEIRKLSEYTNTPIIGLSANVLESDKRACYDAGMNGFIPKPLNFKLFTSVVDSCLHLKSDETLVTTENLQKNNIISYKAQVPIDIDAYINRMGGNKEIAIAIIKGFIKHMPELLNNIVKAIEVADVKTVDREAHSIKGGAANVFAIDLMIAAKDLEMHAKSSRLDQAQELLEKIRAEYKLVFDYAGIFIDLK